MKAIVTTNYGPADVLQLQEVAKPAHKEDEVLVKIHAATVTAGDCEMRRMEFPTWVKIPLRIYIGWWKPRINIFGQEFSGMVEAVGKNVTKFKPGDEVFGPTEASLGAYAEYICISEKKTLSKKPANLSFEEAATIPTGGLNALHFISLAQIQQGDKILINGAGGSIGACGIQLAKNKGAEITAVDSIEKEEMMRSLGADHFIDYGKENFWELDEKFDVIFDIAGKSHFHKNLTALSPTGRYLVTNPGPGSVLLSAFQSRKKGRKIVNSIAQYQQDKLDRLAELAGEGKIRQFIDRVYPLEKTAEAHRYVDTGSKKGNVVLRIE